MSPRSALLLLVTAVGCGKEVPWDLDASELLVHGEAVIEAVASLPECSDAIRRGGKVLWRARVDFETCSYLEDMARGCLHLDVDPPVLEVLFESAWGPKSYWWDTSNPDRSTLATMLCRVCGYKGWEVGSCAERARAAFLTAGGRPGGDKWLAAWQQDAAELGRQTEAVIAAVASVPPCRAAMERGGRIQWRAQLATCTPCSPYVLGCYEVGSEHARVDLVFESAYEPANRDPRGLSTLAHELCHVCGYVDEFDAMQCEQDAQAEFHWR